MSKTPIGVSEGWTRVYDLAWPLGFALSASVHVLLSKLFPPVGLGEVDEEDVFGTFTEKRLGYQVKDDADSKADTDSMVKGDDVSVKELAV